jgi:3-oxoacyl-[acyl-carrier-protein] synthase III
MNTDAPLTIRGIGAVSAAGWSAADLVAAVKTNRELPWIVSERSIGSRDWECRVRPVPAPPPEKHVKHPRLRRVSNVSRFAMSAGLEALGSAKPESLGLIVCLMNGCVAFTNRFYNEVIDEPALASPILFPETVFNAPASHIAAYLGISGQVTTLIGEPNLVAEAMRMATDWMKSGLVEQCLVIAAEEADWLSTEAVGYYDKRLIVTEGAGALLLALDGDGPRIEQIAGPMAYHSNRERVTALAQLASATTQPEGGILIDGAMGLPRLDNAEREAWSWAGETISPHRVLGEGMGCASALQLVLAAALASDDQRSSVVSMPGTNTAAYACVVQP